MAAPVKDVSIRIDKITKTLNQKIYEINRVLENETTNQDYASLLEECVYEIDCAVSEFEELRENNARLREWGESLEEQVIENLERIKYLENIINETDNN